MADATGEANPDKVSRRDSAGAGCIVHACPGGGEIDAFSTREGRATKMHPLVASRFCATRITVDSGDIKPNRAANAATWLNNFGCLIMIATVLACTSSCDPESSKLHGVGSQETKMHSVNIDSPTSSIDLALRLSNEAKVNFRNDGCIIKRLNDVESELTAYSNQFLIGAVLGGVLEPPPGALVGSPIGIPLIFDRLFVVRHGPANVRRDPGINSDIVTRLPVGARVTAVAQTQGWYLVVLDDGHIGNVYDKLISPLVASKQVPLSKQTVDVITAYMLTHSNLYAFDEFDSSLANQADRLGAEVGNTMPKFRSKIFQCRNDYKLCTATDYDWDCGINYVICQLAILAHG